jgi:hypothetical protein
LEDGTANLELPISYAKEMEDEIKDYEKLMTALGNRNGWVEYCFYNPLI